MKSLRGRAALMAAFGLIAGLAAIPASAGTVGAGFSAHLSPVPHDPAADGGSKVTGRAHLTRMAGRLHVVIHAKGLTPGLSHAMHIHGELKARNECPTARADVNSEVLSTDPGTPDGLISLGEGGPSYGPVQVSLPTKGDTSAASALELERFIVADNNGRIDYNRTFQIPKKVAAKLGKLHVVLHGLDLDNDGSYSNLQEATLPVACGEINHR